MSFLDDDFSVYMQDLGDPFSHPSLTFNQGMDNAVLNDPFYIPQLTVDLDLDAFLTSLNMPDAPPYIADNSSNVSFGSNNIPTTPLDSSGLKGEFTTQAAQTPNTVSSIPSESVSGSSSSPTYSAPRSTKKATKGKVRSKYMSDEDLAVLREKNRMYQAKSRRKVKMSLEDLEGQLAERDELIARLKEENSELKGRLWAFEHGMGSGPA